MTNHPSSGPISLLGISGSLRSGSHNTALLRAAAQSLGPGVTLTIAPLSDLPIYNWDDEQHAGFSTSVVALREQVAAADGLLFATPEYNWSVSGALKNAIDWLSRSPSPPIDHKPAAIMGVGGGSGTWRSQEHLRDILGHNRLRIVAEPEVMLIRSKTRFADDELVDEGARLEVHALVTALTGVVERARRVPPPNVDGSVLVLGNHRATMRRVTQQLNELGYRTLPALDLPDALAMIEGRTLAAIVVGHRIIEASREAVRTRLETAQPATPLILPASPDVAAAEVDAALRPAGGPV